MSAFDDDVVDAVGRTLYEGDIVAYIGLVAGRRGEAELRNITEIRKGDVINMHIKLNGSNRKVMPWNVIRVEQTI